jgi:ABC-type multidrug transport system fused ATPase/permease subunit
MANSEEEEQEEQYFLNTEEQEEEHRHHRLQNYDQAIQLQNRILLNNQEKFNKNFDYTNELDKTILTKDKLIDNNNYTNKRNDKMINILGSTLFLLFLIGIIGVLIYFKVLSIKIAKYIILVFVLVYIYKVFIQVKYRDFSKISEQTSQDLDDSLNNYLNNKKNSKLFNNQNDEYTCPNTCSTISEESDSNINKDDISLLVPYKRYMNTDSQRDVWKYGSAYDTLYTSEDEPDIYKNPKNLPIYRSKDDDYIEPRQWVNGKGVNSNNGLFYTCKWQGSPEKRFAPYEQSYERTNIPCQYYPGFSTSKIEYCEVENDEPKNCRIAL